MTDYTYDENIFSDLHKECVGFRPRNHEFWYATPDKKQEIWDYYIKELDIVMAEEEQMKQEAISRFEKLVKDTIEMGANTRKRAIEWIIDGMEEDGDIGFIEYHWGVPYGYIEKQL